jgi:hypothetical protein
MSVALLNPPVEAAVCQSMMTEVDRQLKLIEKDLAEVLMDRELYLQKLGAAQQLRTLSVTLNTLYERSFVK